VLPFRVVSSTRRNVTNRARLAAALALLAFVVGNLGSLVHQAAITHTRCPEHGELIHAAAAPDSAQGAGPFAARLGDHLAGRDRAGDARMAGALPRSASHEHDHCYIICSPRELTDAASAAPAGHAPASARALLALAVDAGSSGRPLYLTAPKTSPPV